MKNRTALKAIAALTLGGTAAIGMMFAGCSNEHTHKYSTDWGKDETGHWHYATCDDLKEGDKDYKIDFAAHTYGDDDECDVCHYTRTPEVTEYTVTLNLGGGTLANGAATTLTTVSGKLSALPTPTAPANKKFKGWYTAATGGTKVDTAYTFTGETKTVTIYAQYEDAVTEYTVTLNAHGGTLAGTATIKTVGGKITLPEAPAAAKPELTFKGWYTAETDGEEVTAETVFDKDTTIHAQWKATDGIYTADGKLISALEWVAPGDSAKKQYGAAGVELAPGDVFQIKVEGAVLSHDQGKLELWTADGTHGVNINQSAGTFTVKPGEERAFEIYAKYYEDGTPCWSIYINDGVKDVLHIGGAYLVGSGWENGDWNISADNYIDPENGLTVTLNKDASFKITDCVDADENRGWKYNDSSYYKVANNAEGYLDLGSIGASGNGSVLAAGEYTITVEEDKEADTIMFVFTPAESVTPAPVEDKYVAGGYYLAGEGFEGAQWNVAEGFYIDPQEGLTVTFNAGANFQIVSCKSASTGGANWDYGNASFYKMSAGKEEGYVNLAGNGNKKVLAAGEYTITLDNSGETPVFVVTPAASVTPAPVEDKYVAGGFYLVGAGFAGAEWGIKEGFYVDPEAGLTVTFEKNALFKVVPSKDATTGGNGGANWDYNSQYKMSTGAEEGYITLGGGQANCVVKTAGEYKITVETVEEAKIIVITPAEGLQPDQTVEVLHYYIKGKKVTNNWQEPKEDKYELKETTAARVYELTIVMEADDEFLFYSMIEDGDGNPTIKGTVELKGAKLEEGITCVKVADNGNIQTKAAGTYKFTYNSETEKLNIEFTAAATPAPVA